MAITAALVTSLSGGKVDYIPITPNAQNFTKTLPPGTWLVQVEVSSSSTASAGSVVTLNGINTNVGPVSSVLVTRILSGGNLTGTTDRTNCIFTHGTAIRLGD